MKNLLLTQCFALFCSLFLFNATTAQTEYKIDSIQQFNLDTPSMILTMQLRSHNTFDNNGTKETQQLTLFKEMSAWDNLTQSLNTYDANNNIIVKILQSWDPDAAAWMNSSKTDFTYDAAQNNTLIANSLTFDNGATWNLFSDTQMEYNANNQITVSTSRSFDFILNALVNSSRDLYTYVNMNLTETIHQNWSAGTSQWVNFEKDVNTFTGNLITQEDSFHWTANDWEAMPFERDVLTYNGSDQLLTLTSLVNIGGTLVNSEKATNTYTNNRLTETLLQSWNTAAEVWDNSARTTYAYDGNGNLNEFNTDEWTASTWLNIYRQRQFWSVAIPFNLGVDDQNSAVFYVFPNPFYDTLEIRLKRPLDNEGQIQIFDMYGKTIISTYVPQGQDHIQLDLNSSASGMYIVTINTGDQHKSFKVIKQ